MENEENDNNPFTMGKNFDLNKKLEFKPIAALSGLKKEKTIVKNKSNNNFNFNSYLLGGNKKTTSDNFNNYLFGNKNNTFIKKPINGNFENYIFGRFKNNINNTTNKVKYNKDNINLGKNIKVDNFSSYLMNKGTNNLRNGNMFNNMNNYLIGRNMPNKSNIMFNNIDNFLIKKDRYSRNNIMMDGDMGTMTQGPYTVDPETKVEPYYDESPTYAVSSYGSQLPVKEVNEVKEPGRFARAVNFLNKKSDEAFDYTKNKVLSLKSSASNVIPAVAETGAGALKGIASGISAGSKFIGSLGNQQFIDRELYNKGGFSLGLGFYHMSQPKSIGGGFYEMGRTKSYTPYPLTVSMASRGIFKSKGVDKYNEEELRNMYIAQREANKYYNPEIEKIKAEIQAINESRRPGRPRKYQYPQQRYYPAQQYATPQQYTPVQRQTTSQEEYASEPKQMPISVPTERLGKATNPKYGMPKYNKDGTPAIDTKTGMQKLEGSQPGKSVTFIRPKGDLARLRPLVYTTMPASEYGKE